ncbi:MAG: SAM-dependent methyltransferase [Chloroflexi bacterium]|nr:SAM-dependent methyltransferase [Chloroflexota bacterium]
MKAESASAGISRAFDRAGRAGYGAGRPSIDIDDLLNPANGDPVPESVRRKELGAYYTDVAVARFLLRWALTTGKENVLDPSSGDGVFLAEAAERIRDLGGNPSRQLFGIEIDPVAHRRFAARGAEILSTVQLLHASFFDVVPGQLPSADAVVGNPPFIRYQRFSGDARDAALLRARDAGVELSRLTSSWAPFLVHAVQFVKPGGRLAMVAPAELTHAGYARPVLDYLRSSFGSTRILSFSRRIFPTLSEDTVLLLAAGRGEPFETFQLIDLPGLSALEEYTDPSAALPDGVEIDASPLRRDHERVLHYLLPHGTRHLYRQLRESGLVTPLRSLAQVGIGYVTGDNAFFHLDAKTIDGYRIPSHFLRPAACRGSELPGLRFTREDWESLRLSGHPNSLLHIQGMQSLPESVEAYLRQGVRRGVPDRYKCRVRKPWYSVPHVYEASGFLTYMSGGDPKLVANEADAVAPNTLHIVRLAPNSRVGTIELAAAWQTSLTALSCEMEGHSLGGGMLKLEPTEAGRVAVALPDFGPGGLNSLAADLDALLRAGKPELARELADGIILRQGLGLSASDIQQLREGWLLLKGRRRSR